MNYGIKDAANVVLQKISDGKPFIKSEYANVTTNEWSSAQTYAMAKGSRAIRWDHAKESTLVMDMEVFELKWLAVVAGKDWVTGATDIFKNEVLYASETNTITIAETPTTGSLSVFKLESDLVTHGEEQVAGAPVTETNEYSIDAKVITLNETTAPEGTAFVVYYAYESGAGAQQLTFTANDFPEAFEVIADTYIRPKGGGVDEFVQIHYLNARPMPNFTLTMDASNAANLSITFDLLPDAKGNIATYTVI